MIPPRYRMFLAATALLLLALAGYYSLREPSPTTRSSGTSAKIASAKARLQQTLEDQNKNLKHALEVARASLKEHHAAAPVPTPTPPTVQNASPKQQDTGSFAYVFYATTDPYACSVLVNIHRLTTILHTTLAIHVLASQDISTAYLTALRSAGATVHILDPPPLPEGGAFYYKDSLLKLRAFELHKLAPELKRVLVLDGDQLVLKNLDRLFTSLPDVDLAAPRAYWLSSSFVASTFMLISLSDRLWMRVERAMQRNMILGSQGMSEVQYDMDVVNAVLGDVVMVLSGEYVCLNSHWEDWNLPTWYRPERELNWTTIRRVNELARMAAGGGFELFGGGNKRSLGGVGDGGILETELEGVREKRQIFSHTDLPPEVLALEPPPPPTLVPNPTLAILPPPPPEALLSLAPIPSTPPYLPPAAQIQQNHQPLSPQPEQDPAPPLAPFMEPQEPTPRFPLTHPLALELERLFSPSSSSSSEDNARGIGPGEGPGASVLHFTAVGKPWTYDTQGVQSVKPDAHPVLAAQFAVWRAIAGEVCPGGVEGLGVGAGLGEVVGGKSGEVGDGVTAEGTEDVGVGVGGDVGSGVAGAEPIVAATVPTMAGFGVPVAAASTT